jgi:regulator of protease activity HflC (stomatin/prohibitin superfamily)
VPKLKLDDVFTSKNEISMQIREQLDDSMDDFGFEIIATPITDIDPDRQVKQAMNEINRQARLRVAAENEGEGQRILAMKKAQAIADATRIQAEADSEAKFLQGSGIARQREAILQGMHSDVLEFSSDIQSITAKDVMETILLTQYFDCIKDIGQGDRNCTVYLPHGPGAVHEISQQLRQGFLINESSTFHRRLKSSAKNDY